MYNTLQSSVLPRSVAVPLWPAPKILLYSFAVTHVRINP